MTGNSLHIAPLEPDRLGEVLVADVLRDQPGLLAAALDAASDRQLTRALTVAVRAGRDDAAVDEQLRDALDDRLPDLFRRALGADGPDLLAAVTVAMTGCRPARGAFAAAGMFPPPLSGCGPSRQMSQPWPSTDSGLRPATTRILCPAWPLR